jgi:hypothetical protein
MGINLEMLKVTKMAMMKGFLMVMKSMGKYLVMLMGT